MIKMSTPLLNVVDWTVKFNTKDGLLFANQDINLKIFPKQIVGLMGFSGCGKSVLARSIIGTHSGENKESKIFYKDKRIDNLSSRKKKQYKQRDLMLISQENLSALDPLLTPISVIKSQWKRVNRYQFAEKNESVMLSFDSIAEREASKWIEKTSLDNLLEYSNCCTDLKSPLTKEMNKSIGKFSGGMMQTLLLTQVLISKPELVICDETTTGMDVTLQKTIFDLLSSLVHSDEYPTSLLLITHDFDLLAEYCDYIYLMDDGKIITHDPKNEMLKDSKVKKGVPGQRKFSFTDEDMNNKFIYNISSLDNNKILNGYNAKLSEPVKVLSIEELNVYSDSKNRQHILKNISLDLGSNEWLGIVGESGSGKTTLLRTIKGIYRNITIEGDISFLHESIHHIHNTDKNRGVQYINQNVTSSFNPLFNTQEIIEEYSLGVKENGNNKVRQDLLYNMLEKIGLKGEYLKRIPASRDFSGGQKQLIAWARAFFTIYSMLQDGVPNHHLLLLLDEPFSNLDIRIQRILKSNLMKLKGIIPLILVSHDLHRVVEICDRMIIMKKGVIVEQIECNQFFDPNRSHSEYTQRLVESLPNVLN